MSSLNDAVASYIGGGQSSLASSSSLLGNSHSGGSYQSLNLDSYGNNGNGLGLGSGNFLDGAGGGLGGGLGGGFGGGNVGTGGAQVSAAIQTKRTVEVKPIVLQSDPIEPHVVDVEASFQPVQVVFRSSSSPVMVQQIHTPAQPIQVEPTQSEDEPHRVQHQVMRPVIQEIREIIQPYRRVLQEIRPVLEEVRTIVAKAENSGPGAGPGGAGGLGGLNGPSGPGGLGLGGAGAGAGAGAGEYGPGAGNGIVLASDSYGNGGGGAGGARGPLRSLSQLRKGYSRRSGPYHQRRYSDRARS
ncbi:DFP2-like protein 26 [Sarcoptes scabiei]|uniref:DFP2-like protein 26 n=1 Tax=Sarcoptes scabiei TaxID=52283 RepID=A0A132A966_SARSC|nr:DFP2-like protein 26 [Sarcoptes scabiei]